MEKAQQTTQKCKRIIKDYNQQLYANKMDNLEEMEELFQKYNLP